MSGFATRTVDGALEMVCLWAKRTGREDHNVGEILAEEIRNYLDTSYSTASTKAVVHGQLKRFFDFCQASGFSQTNPARLVHYARSRKLHVVLERESAGFSKDEITRLLEVASPFWKVAITLAYFGGLELRNILTLRWSSFAKHGIVTVTDAEHRRSIDVPITEEMSKAIQTILRNPTATKDDYCFPQERDLYESSTRQAALSVYFGRLCEGAGLVKKRFSDLRRAHFVGALSQPEDDSPKHLIQDFSGVTTAEKYFHSQP
jgi:integrase